MNILQAIVLGAVQGLGEFLPISSSAHLKIIPWLAGWKIGANEAEEQAIDVALHVGTLVALLIYFRAELWQLAQGFFATLKQRRIGEGDGKLAWLVIVGSIPGALIGKLLEHQAEEQFGKPIIIAVAMIVLGLVLYLSDRRKTRGRDLASIGFVDAALIGLAQACAIVPGVSRSGSTISAGRFRSNETTRKCRSMARKPASISRKLSGPMAIMVERPIAESIEYRPPTQLQNPNMLSGSMPNFCTRSLAVERAAK